jgi:hypothetical protein
MLKEMEVQATVVSKMLEQIGLKVELRILAKSSTMTGITRTED